MHNRSGDRRTDSDVLRRAGQGFGILRRGDTLKADMPFAHYSFRRPAPGGEVVDQIAADLQERKVKRGNIQQLKAGTERNLWPRGV